MKIDGEYRFEAPREAVWEALLDPEVLTQVMPGCEKLEKTGDNAYQGALKIKVGPVQGLFNGKVQLDDIEPPERYTMDVDGRGAPGFVKAKANVELAELDEADGGGTLMRYSSDAQVGGRIASVGQRLVDSSAKAIIKQSLDGLDALVRARTATTAAVEGADETATALDQPPAAYVPPTQAELARNVAKEVAKDLIPKPVLIAIVVIAIVIVLALVLVL